MSTETPNRDENEQVMDQMDELMETRKNLFDLEEALEHRLSPVLKNNTDATLAEEPVTELVPLASQLRTEVDALKGLGSHLRTLTDRIAL